MRARHKPPACSIRQRPGARSARAEPVARPRRLVGLLALFWLLAAQTAPAALFTPAPRGPQPGAPVFLPLEPADAPAARGLPAGAQERAAGESERNRQRGTVVEARLQPARPLTLSAPFSGLLTAVEVRDGQRVAPGDVVARFDPQSGDGKSDEAALQAGGALDLEERLAKATLAAPFAGRVTEVRAQAGQRLKQGDPVAELAEDGDMEIVCTVPSAWTARLSPGHVIWVWVDESAQSYEAVFERFGGKVDPASKTIRAYARFIPPAEELLPGMSGRANFFPPRRAGE